MKAIAVVSLMSLGVIALPALASPSHCKAQEHIVFSCSLGEKTVSACASADFSPNSGYLQYRFGKLGSIELALPKLTPNHPRSSVVVQGKSLLFAGGGGAYLRFIHGTEHYIVYTAIGKGWGVKDGTAIEKDQQLVAYWECVDVPVSLIGDDFFSPMGLPVDQREFLIPGID